MYLFGKISIKLTSRDEGCDQTTLGYIVINSTVVCIIERRNTKTIAKTCNIHLLVQSFLTDPNSLMNLKSKNSKQLYTIKCFLFGFLEQTFKMSAGPTERAVPPVHCYHVAYVGADRNILRVLSKRFSVLMRM